MDEVGEPLLFTLIFPDLVSLPRPTSPPAPFWRGRPSPLGAFEGFSFDHLPLPNSQPNSLGSPAHVLFSDVFLA